MVLSCVHPVTATYPGNIVVLIVLLIVYYWRYLARKLTETRQCSLLFIGEKTFSWSENGPQENRRVGNIILVRTFELVAVKMYHTLIIPFSIVLAEQMPLAQSMGISVDVEERATALELLSIL